MNAQPSYDHAVLSVNVTRNHVVVWLLTTQLNPPSAHTHIVTITGHVIDAPPLVNVTTSLSVIPLTPFGTLPLIWYITVEPLNSPVFS